MYHPSEHHAGPPLEPEVQSTSFWLDILLAPAHLVSRGGWIILLLIAAVPMLLTSLFEGYMLEAIAQLQRAPGYEPLLELLGLALAAVIVSAIPTYYTMKLVESAALNEDRIPGFDGLSDVLGGVLFVFITNFMFALYYVVPGAVVFLIDRTAGLVMLALGTVLFPLSWMLAAVHRSSLVAHPLSALRALARAPLAYLAVLVLFGLLSLGLLWVTLRLDVQGGQATLVDAGLRGVWFFGTCAVSHLLGRLHYRYLGAGLRARHGAGGSYDGRDLQSGRRQLLLQRGGVSLAILGALVLAAMGAIAMLPTRPLPEHVRDPALLEEMFSQVVSTGSLPPELLPDGALPPTAGTPPPGELAQEERPVEARPEGRREAVRPAGAGAAIFVSEEGGEAYREHCASCHDAGSSRAPGAPKMGDEIFGNISTEGTFEMIESAVEGCTDPGRGTNRTHDTSRARIESATLFLIARSAR